VGCVAEQLQTVDILINHKEGQPSAEKMISEQLAQSDPGGGGRMPLPADRRDRSRRRKKFLSPMGFSDERTQIEDEGSLESCGV